MMGISIWQLLIILVIVVLLFGTKKLRNMGGDLGGAIKSFRKAVKDGGDNAAEGESQKAALDNESKGSVIEGETVAEDGKKDKEKV